MPQKESNTRIHPIDSRRSFHTRRVTRAEKGAPNLRRRAGEAFWTIGVALLCLAPWHAPAQQINADVGAEALTDALPGPHQVARGGHRKRRPGTLSPSAHGLHALASVPIAHVLSTRSPAPQVLHRTVASQAAGPLISTKVLGDYCCQCGMVGHATHQCQHVKKEIDEFARMGSSLDWEVSRALSMRMYRPHPRLRARLRARSLDFTYLLYPSPPPPAVWQLRHRAQRAVDHRRSAQVRVRRCLDGVAALLYPWLGWK